MSLDIDSIRTLYSMTTLGYDFSMRGLNAGKVSKDSQDAITEKEREEEMEKITPIYDSRGRIVESHTNRYYVSKRSKRINVLA
jgi:hypothetical protein